MKFAFVVVAWNGMRFLSDCLRSVLSQTLRPHSLIVVDNASDDDSVKEAEGLLSTAGQLGTDLIILGQSRNLGFTRGANVGLRAALNSDSGSEAAVLLNQDATLDPTWSESVAAVLREDEQVGVVGSKIYYPNRLTIQHAGGFLERPRLVGRHYGHHNSDSKAMDGLREVEFVTAAVMALRLDALREVGLFDEIYSPGYYEDVELCERMANAGWKVVYCSSAVATHIESASFTNRAQRLSLSHSSRLVFALASLADTDSREEFLEAERLFLAGGILPDERRALASAYLSIILALPGLTAARVPPSLLRAELVEVLIEIFCDLRRRALSANLTTTTIMSPRSLHLRC